MATQAMTGMFEAPCDRYSEGVDAHTTRWAAERRARRGPTPELFFTKRMDNSRLVKAQCPQRSREMRSFASAMAMLFVLVMFYGWQHLSSIEYGYRVEGEKQQLLQLEEQNRQLRLTEAQLGDPARIDRMARQLGMATPRPGQVVRAEAGRGEPGASVMAEVRLPAIGR
ncbi:MAG TPA: cell division protein FtsL [Acidobacteriaceae bacterium]